MRHQRSENCLKRGMNTKLKFLQMQNYFAIIFVLLEDEYLDVKCE